MNRKLAKELAQTITNEELQQMFDNAKAGIMDWTRVSTVNKGMTKGTAWNILTRDFDVTKQTHILGKINMIREFGDFLPGHLKKSKEKKTTLLPPPIHQDPKF